MNDQYGNQVPDDLVLLPDIRFLDEEGIKIVDSATWYDIYLDDGTIWLCVSANEIDYLSDCPVVDDDFPKPIKILQINNILKRCSEEDGFYHASESR